MSDRRWSWRCRVSSKASEVAGTVSASPKIEDFRDPSFDPFKAAKEQGGDDRVFHPELKRLREINPVFDGDLRRHFGLTPDLTMLQLRHVAILGHREVKQALTDTDTYSNAAYEHNLGVYFGRSITTMDNPDHARYRRLFQQAFGPNSISKWGAEIIPRAINRLIDRFEQRGRAELVNDFTLFFPFHFIHELMALPAADRDAFHRLAFGQILITFDYEHGMEAVEKLRVYLTEIVRHRRDNPIPDDFISMIATAEVEGERLPDEVVISFFRQLMNAGGDTSYNGFSTVMAALLTHPDQLERVKHDRGLVPKAIEEALRWNAPVTMLARTPKRSVVLVGVKIEPGDHMGVILPAANRDPAAFDRPDTFDITRATRIHAAFGYGPHICIGQHLARLEMCTALNALLDRLPNLRADDAYPPAEISGFMLRGPASLHVRFD
jgi:cytochrome P450